jgi:hypothetical protein
MDDRDPLDEAIQWDDLADGGVVVEGPDETGALR